MTVTFRVLGKVIAAWWAFRTAENPQSDEERARVEHEEQEDQAYYDRMDRQYSWNYKHLPDNVHYHYWHDEN